MNSQMASLSLVAHDAASSETNPSFDVTTFAENFAVLAEGVTSVLHLRRLAMTLAVRGRIVLPDLSTPHPFAGNAPPEEPEGAFESPHVSPSDDELAEVSVPSNWAKLKLGSLVNLEYGKSLPKNSRAGHGKFPVFGSNGVVGVHDEALVAEPCIIVGRKGSSGAVALSPGPCWPIDTAYFVRCPKALLIEYLLLVLRVLRLDRFDRSTAIPGLNRADAYALTVTVPPMAEQKRIVAKVDQLMALCDDLEARQTKKREIGTRLTKSALEALTAAESPAEFDIAWSRVAENFDVLIDHAERVSYLRSSILGLACRGALTRRGPGSGQDVLARIAERRSAFSAAVAENREGARHEKKLASVRLPTHTGPLPPGWAWATLLESCWQMVDCHNKTAPYTFAGVALVRTSNIRDGKIDLDGVRFVSEETYARWSRRCPPQPGDLLFTREAPMGEVGLVEAGMHVCMGQRMMLLRTFDDLVDPRYLVLAIRDPSFQRRMHLAAVGSTVKHLRVGDVEGLAIPVPPLEEQRAIVMRVADLMRVCDDLEAKLLRAEDRAARLVEAAVQELVAS